tara:strand:- start:391 stop:738 length:348 start_codon:yes stop_codon:yes gene_type:complete
MSITVSGEVFEVFPTNKVSDRFTKREFVVKTTENEEYPEYLKMEVIQDKCGHLDYIKKGDMVDVSINLKGRPWNNPKTQETSYFNTLQAWKIDKADSPTHSISEDNGNEPESLPF